MSDIVETEVEDCEWTCVDFGSGQEMWNSDCGEEHIGIDPEYLNFTFCPYCGKELIVVFPESEDDSY